MGEPEYGPQFCARSARWSSLLAGLQGAGKTTSAGKLARWLDRETEQESADWSARRVSSGGNSAASNSGPAVGSGFCSGGRERSAVAIAKRALTEATLQAYDVLLLDTAAVCTWDADMMTEVKELEAALAPHERLFRGGTVWPARMR